MKKIQISVRIDYFSGTGGVRKVVNELEKQLADLNGECCVFKITNDFIRRRSENSDWEKFDFRFLLYPVHAFDAPEIIYRWIETQQGHGIKTIILSVSGGGPGWPNIGTRSDVIKVLGNRGFKPFYEDMLVMPSNWVVTPDDHGAMYLLRILPEKVKRIVEDVVAGKPRLIHEKKGFIQYWASRLEKKHTAFFAKTIKIAENCNGCGWCVRHCAVENIVIEDNRPRFLNKCLICFQCIYGCPQKALSSRNFQVLKQGYDLEALEKRMEGVALKPLEDCFKGLLWASVKKYCES